MQTTEVVQGFGWTHEHLLGAPPCVFCNDPRAVVSTAAPGTPVVERDQFGEVQHDPSGEIVTTTKTEPTVMAHCPMWHLRCPTCLQTLRCYDFTRESPAEVVYAFYYRPADRHYDRLCSIHDAKKIAEQKLVLCP